MVASSKGQAQMGHRGGSSYTSTARSQYGQSPIRMAGRSAASFVIVWGRWGERSPVASAPTGEALTPEGPGPGHAGAPLGRGAPVALGAGQAAVLLLRFPRGTYAWTGSCCQQ